MVCSKERKYNTAALVTILLCNTLVAQCSRQLIGPADCAFVTLHLHNVATYTGKKLWFWDHSGQFALSVEDKI